MSMDVAARVRDRSTSACHMFSSQIGFDPRRQ